MLYSPIAAVTRVASDGVMAELRKGMAVVRAECALVKI